MLIIVLSHHCSSCSGRSVMNLMNELYLTEMNYVEENYVPMDGSVRMNDFFPLDKIYDRFNGRPQ